MGFIKVMTAARNHQRHFRGSLPNQRQISLCLQVKDVWEEILKEQQDLEEQDVAPLIILVMREKETVMEVALMAVKEILCVKETIARSLVPTIIPVMTGVRKGN